MRTAALGFRVHSGWSALVAVALQSGEPEVLYRKRVQLVEIYNYDYRQPYHTAAKAPFEEGRAFISQVKSQAARLATNALRALEKELRTAGYRITTGVVLQASGRTLPPLEQILGSHSLIHTADGVLFREALADACRRCGLTVLAVKEKALLHDAARAFGIKEAALLRMAAKLGRSFGSPWAQDEKFSALAAWLALAQRTAGRGARTSKVIPNARHNAALA